MLKYVSLVLENWGTMLFNCVALLSYDVNENGITLGADIQKLKHLIMNSSASVDVTRRIL